jgi:hypothetical protein
MDGSAAQSQFDTWVANLGGTHYDFDNLPFHSYLYTLTGVTFRSILDPFGNPLNDPVVVSNLGQNSSNPVREIVGMPWGLGSLDDGRVVYQMTFGSPQRWAGVVRHWGIQNTITRFYEADGDEIATFGPGSGPSSGNYFIGYLADTDDTSHWIARIVCDGIIVAGSKQVGYTNDLYFGTANPNPIPIPGAVWLLGTGLFGLIGLRRKIPL